VLLEKSLLSITSVEERYNAVKNIVLAAIEDGTFTYTELLLSDEALYTVAFMVMDGTIIDSGSIPRTGAHPVIPSGPLRLVCIDTPEKVAADNAGKQPEQHRQLLTMRSSVWHQPRIPGTNQRGKAVKKSTDYGMDAMVDDSLDQGRIARSLLLKYGWPIRNVMSTNGVVGHIVEWRWLERAAQAAGTAPEDQEIRDLYELIKARTEPKATKRQSALPVSAGVSP